jgi:lipopolysaccharide transport system permease protein
LGGVWAIIQPLTTVLLFTVIFTKFIPIETGDIPYVVFSYSAMVPWLLFSTSITDMVDSLVVNMNLVTKIYFPREVLPLAAMLARLVDFGIAYALLIIIMMIYQIRVFSIMWLFLPLIILVELALTLGVGLIGSAMNVFYRDIKHIVTLGLQLVFYATPIIYPMDLVPAQYRFLYYLNPMAGIIRAYRTVLLENSYPDISLVVSAGISILILLIGYVFFKWVEPQFADVV